MNTTIDKLDDFYEMVVQKVRIDNFLVAYHDLFPFIHHNGLTHDYRLARGRLKKLRDEIFPVYEFVKFHTTFLNDNIQFSLSDQAPDCIIWHGPNNIPRKIEVTVTQAKARSVIMRELNNTGESRGYLGLTDDKKWKYFNDAMKNEREMYSTDEYLSNLKCAIELAINRKRNNVSASTLLIGAPISKEYMDADRIIECKAELSSICEELHFSEIYIVDSDTCIQIR